MAAYVYGGVPPLTLAIWKAVPTYPGPGHPTDKAPGTGGGAITTEQDFVTEVPFPFLSVTVTLNCSLFLTGSSGKVAKRELFEKR